MTNNEKLRALMKSNNITYKQFSDVSAFSHSTVKSWLIHSGSDCYRAMPSSSYKLVSMEIGLLVLGRDK